MADKETPKKKAPAKKATEAAAPKKAAAKAPAAKKPAAAAAATKKPAAEKAVEKKPAAAAPKKAAAAPVAVTAKKVDAKVNDKLKNAPAKLVSLHRTVVAEEANRRQGTQSAKTRSEVRGGGRKPYKQKKTGNARQGSIRSPHYAHGGMALAVKPRDYEKKVNRKERRAAILGAISAHLEAGNIQVVDSISFAEAKTKQATALLNSLGLAGERRVLVILPAYDETTYKCFRNLPNVEVRTAPAVAAKEGAEAPKTAVFSARDIMLARKIVVAQEAFSRIQEVWAK
jgi:large subunit ribosomal protein L4